MPILLNSAKDYNKITNKVDLANLLTGLGYSKRKQGDLKKAIVDFLQVNNLKNGIPIVNYGKKLPKIKTVPPKQSTESWHRDLHQQLSNPKVVDFLSNWLQQQTAKKTEH